MLAGTVAKLVHNCAGYANGHIVILVNNARAIIGRDRVPITELREEVWQRFLAINTSAVYPIRSSSESR